MDQFIQFVSLVVYVGASAIAVGFALRQRTRAAWWAAAAFGDLGAIVALGAIIGDAVGGGDRWTPEALLVDLIVLLIVVFPFLLFRFVRELGQHRSFADRLASAALAGLILWTLVAPPFPAPEAPRPAWVQAYTAAFLVWWGVMLISGSWQLRKLGKGQAGVVRGRMRLMALAALLMSLSLLLSSLSSGADQPASVALTTAMLGWASATGFMMGLQPPPFLRRFWRAADEAAQREAEQLLIGATTPAAAAQAVVGVAARLVGGSGAIVTDADGQQLAAVGELDTTRQDSSLTRGTHSEVQVSMSSLTPQFGDGENALLQQLCTHLDLALAHILALQDSEHARTQAEQALGRAEQARAELQQLVYGISHDLRNPLVTISGFLRLISNDPGEMSDTAKLGINRISASTDYIEGLVDGLLQLSRVGRTEGDVVDVHLTQIVGELVADLRLINPSLQIEVHDLPTVRMNAVRARQLFANLLDNAARYGCTEPDAATIRISGNHQEDWACIDVADDGPGIPVDQRERVFQIFQRVDGFDATSQGSGIGLTMCRRIVEDCGGSIHVADTPRGTTMRIMVPGNGLKSD